MKAVNNTDHPDTHKKAESRQFPYGVFWLCILLIIISFLIILYFGQKITDTTAAQYTFIATAFLNVLIFFAIVAQAVIYYAQWAVMERQGALMNESLIETRKAAEAAQRSADDANLTMRLSHYAYLEMVDWKVESDGEFVAYEDGSLVNSRPKFLYISCRIINAGNIPATMYSIETRWGPKVVTVNPSATVIPLSVGYIYRHTIDMSIYPPATNPDSTKEHVGGTLSGQITYEHFFGKRIRHFHQIFWWKKSTGECGIDPMEGAGNNDEPAPYQNPN